MDKIYSKVQPGLLLHQIFKRSDVVDGRVDIICPDNFIQCSSLRLKKDTTFKAHKHVIRERTWNVIAQESWFVFKGSVICYFYDIDGKEIRTVTLNAGDASFTLAGGHNYQILEDGTEVMEYKTGRYEGQNNDKVFL